MTVNDVKEKIRLGNATIGEIAWGASQDKYLLMNTLMDNNLADVNVTLRTELGNDKILDFAPNRSQIQAVIQGYIESNNDKSLQTIIDEFDYDPKANNYTTKLAFLQNLQNGNLANSRLDFSGVMGEIGVGLGNFVGPVANSLGSENTTQSSTSTKPSNTSAIVVVVVLIIVIVAAIIIFRSNKKESNKQTPLPQLA
ncbi:MAG: hypothetical protein V4506_19245 [Bacteroidota bacterium]